MPPPDGTEADAPRRGPLRRLLVGLGLGVAALSIGLWIYALFFYDPGLMIDQLADRTFPKHAEQVCATARTRIDELPPAEETREPAQRADTIDQANRDLRDMTAALSPIVPSGQGRISKGIHEWIADWNTYIQDRQEYADALRKDPAT
ncbi:MAG: hypothetical protein JST64_13440, partial [Actinobacteria bacterium]|nr:hypothetical protein [Actinomycetota bacterium]